jgi:hypothetical protein
MGRSEKMTEFVSDVKTIPHSNVDVYRVLSDLNKLELVKDRLPMDKISDFTFDADSVSFKIDPIGSVKFVVIEREENKLVKLKSEAMPIDVFLWVQLVSASPNETKLRLTARAELNVFIKPMVEKPMKEAVNQISEMLVALPYGDI